jgi:hypothetical protein
VANAAEWLRTGEALELSIAAGKVSDADAETESGTASVGSFTAGLASPTPKLDAVAVAASVVVAIAPDGVVVFEAGKRYRRTDASPYWLIDVYATCDVKCIAFFRSEDSFEFMPPRSENYELVGPCHLEADVAEMMLDRAVLYKWPEYRNYHARVDGISYHASRFGGSVEGWR